MAQEAPTAALEAVLQKSEAMPEGSETDTRRAFNAGSSSVEDLEQHPAEYKLVVRRS